MKIAEIISSCKLQLVAGKDAADREVTGGYTSDLLSDAIAHCKAGVVWITLQTHPNIVAVGALKEISGIIIVNGRTAEQETIAKAESEGIALMATESSAFEVTGRLYGMGLR